MPRVGHREAHSTVILPRAHLESEGYEPFGLPAEGPTLLAFQTGDGEKFGVLSEICLHGYWPVQELAMVLGQQRP